VTILELKRNMNSEMKESRYVKKLCKNTRQATIPFKETCFRSSKERHRSLEEKGITEEEMVKIITKSIIK
jgi:hypothetical protein